MAYNQDLSDVNSDLGSALYCVNRYGLATCDGVGKTGSAVYTAVRCKIYNGELGEVMIANKPVFKAYDGDDSNRSKRHKSKDENDDFDPEKGSPADSADSLQRSKRRARKAVFDYAMSNPDLDVFITLTLSPEQIDRTDYNAIVKKLNSWLDYRVRKHGLKYVLVAEYHKDGEAIHFHGLVNSTAVELVDSGKKDKKGHKVYNLPEWRLGFTTAIKVYGGKTRGGVCKYICKYIGKSDSKVGGRWYYSGGDLQKPEYEYMIDTRNLRKTLSQMPDMEHYTYHVDGTDKTYEIYTRNWD